MKKYLILLTLSAFATSDLSSTSYHQRQKNKESKSSGAFLKGDSSHKHKPAPAHKPAHAAPASSKPKAPQKPGIMSQIKSFFTGSK